MEEKNRRKQEIFRNVLMGVSLANMTVGLILFFVALFIRYSPDYTKADALVYVYTAVINMGCGRGGVFYAELLNKRAANSSERRICRYE